MVFFIWQSIIIYLNNQYQNMSKSKTWQSTRTIDRCIQEYFTKGQTFVYESRDNADLNKALSLRFERRLSIEHSQELFTKEFKSHDGIPCHKYVRINDKNR
jgi:hypothetical protein